MRDKKGRILCKICKKPFLRFHIHKNYLIVGDYGMPRLLFYKLSSKYKPIINWSSYIPKTFRSRK